MATDRRYELVKDDTITANCHVYILYRVRALRDFGDVRAGDLGGYIEDEKNLAQDGSAWVYEGGVVYGDAYIRNNARIYGGEIYGGVIRGGVISGGEIYGGVILGGEILGGVISDNARIDGGEITGGKICNHAHISGGLILGGVIRGNAHIGGGVIYGGAIYGGAIRGNAYITGGLIRGGVIHGGEIYGGVIYGGEIRDGIWNSSPLQIQGTKYFCNIESPGMLRIGCVSYPVEEWPNIFDELCLMHEVTDPDVRREYRAYIDLALALKDSPAVRGAK